MSDLDKFDDKLIPPGPYCYTPKEVKDGALKIDLCPYWCRTQSGLVVCLYTGAVEVDNDTEAYDAAVARYGEEVLEMLTSKSDGLLWDQVKGCGINDDECYEDDEDGHDCYSCGKCAC